MSNLKKVASLLLAGMLTSQSVTVDGGVQIVKAEEATAIEVPAKEVAAEEVLEIATVEDFKAFVKRVNAGETFEGKTVRLVNDIAYDGVTVNNFEPIGSSDCPFSGTLDGAGHSISGMIIINKEGYIFDTLLSATIKNLTVTDCEFNVSDSAAGLVNLAKNSKILNCQIGENVELSAPDVAGIALSIENSEIKNCSLQKNVNISGENNIAGIAITSTDSDIINCKISDGMQIDSEGDIGGITVSVQGTNIISCENSAVITGSGIVAGIAVTASSSKILNCGNRGDLVSEGVHYWDKYIEKYENIRVAGIIGTAQNCVINSCYNQGVISGRAVVGGIAAVTTSTNIYNSINKGNILNEGEYECAAGGIVGIFNGGYISNCSNQALIDMNRHIYACGGIVGEINELDNDNITNYIQNCFNTGKIENDAYYSGSFHSSTGIVGWISYSVSAEDRNTTTVISNSYYITTEDSEDGSISAITRNVCGKTATEMQSQEFLDLINKHRGSNTDWLPWVATSTYPTIKQCGVVMINNSVLGIYDEGTTVSFTITPTEGYQASSPLLNNGEVTYREDGDLTYSFSMPAGFVQIEYEEIKIEATPTPTIEVTATPEVQVTTAPNVTDTASPEGNATPNPTNTTTPTGDTTPVPTTVPTLAPTNTPAPIPMMEPVNNTLVLYVGGNTQQTKKYTTKVSNIKNYSISYESTKASVASVSSDGKITAKKAGTAVIYAHVKDKTSGKSYPFVLANVTVKKAGLSFSKKVTSLKVKKTATFKVKKNGIKGTVKWSVSNKKLASITSKGVLKAKKAGKVKVTAACGNKKATVSVTIKK